MFAWLKGLPALGVRDALGVSFTLYGCYRWLRPGGRRARLTPVREGREPAPPVLPQSG